MKKLALSALLVIMLFGSGLAHTGAISLYIMDQTVMICNKDLGYLETATIGVYYVKDLGYDLGNALEFKLISSNPASYFGTVTWVPEITVIMGDIESGISLTAGACLGFGQDVVHVGDVDVFLADQPTLFTVRVIDNPNAAPPGIHITRCDENQTQQTVLGGTFVFNGTCNPGVEPTTWSAIKELYK